MSKLNSTPWLYLALSLTMATPAAAENSLYSTPDAPALTETDANQVPPASRRLRTQAILGAYTFATALYGYQTWWGKDVQRHELQPDGSVTTETLANRTSNFSVRHEGWFGADTPNGGADKLGHAFSFYLSTRLLSKGLRWAGQSRADAARMAGITAGAVSLAVEILDGYSLEYGFSTEDLIMNLVGIGSATWLEAHPQWDDLIDLRFRYSRSGVAKQVGERDPVSDYSGQTYMLVLKASGVPGLRENKFLRYLEFDLGYGSRGYQPTLGPFADTQTKERFVYYGLSLNLSQILNDTAYRSNSQPSTTQKITTETFEYLQLPGTDLLLKHRL